ncbi:MAG: hypothetical protein ACQ9MH_14345 [Nitrospinales bacterium]
MSLKFAADFYFRELMPLQPEAAQRRKENETMIDSIEKFTAKDPRLEGPETFVRPEDFSEGSVWRRMAEAYGVGCVLMLAWELGGDKTYIPSYEAATNKGSQRRRAERRKEN